ncbi:hypothetical protein BJV74DRAFT_53711 [Russula compacta]|nr:hypothetical protein BJV74DRAFT_53711 [Russula compacta]
MSQFRGRSLNLGAMPTAAVSTDGRHSPPRSVQNQVPRNTKSDFIDGSREAFRTYLEREDEKVKRVESQRADANEILIFAALLAGTVATLIGASVRGLQIDPLDKWAFYLLKTHELLAEDKEPYAYFISTTIPDPTRFAPARSAVLINSLWFLSLAVSLSCIMLASLPQRWTHQYHDAIGMGMTGRSRNGLRNPATAAAPRASVDGAEDDLPPPWLIKALPTLLHMALYLFFSGFAVFVFNLTSSYGIAQALLLTAGSLISPLFCFWRM